MIKQILFLFSLIGLFFTRLFVSDSINVTQEVPSQIKAGSEFIVRVNIEKGDLQTYANYTLKLPRGLTAELCESTKGDFSFKDQYVNVSWEKLPKEKNIQLSYKIKVGQHLKGKINFSGIFSLIKNNKREKIIMPINTVNILTDEADETGNVNCERDAPTSVAPGDIFIVKIKVNKGAISGFAKIQELLPPGFSAEPVETQNAIFSFEDQKVKFLWMSLTPNESFIVSYKVKVGDDVSGIFKIEGSFFYVENNETIKQEISSSTISVSSEEADNSEITFKGQEGISTEKPKTEESNLEAKNKTKEEDAAKLEAEKQAREEAQAGKEAEEVQKKQLEDESAKKKEEERLKQEAEAQKKAEDEALALAMVKAKEDSIKKAEEEKQKQAQEAEVRMKAEEEERQKQIEADSRKKAEAEEQQKKQQQESEASKTTSSEIISDSPATTTELNYRVQIAAIKTSVSKEEYFKKRYHVEEQIFAETHEGWFKYTVGGYGTYSDAKNKRTSVNNEYGIKGPFVTAYNQGKRITVQEALMISKQNWVQ
jgi:hypothetical protein